jgi:drug/metabolite transporter (DMT)-like permease
MTHAPDPPLARPPSPWALVVAFTAIYLSWGTTYLAIKTGVAAFPPFLFGGLRVIAAGLVLLGYLAWRREPLRLPPQELLWMALVGCLFFLGGNGLVTLGSRWVDSGVTSVLVATTPLWMALLELLWPRGERLTGRGWLGLSVGLAGVLLLYLPQLNGPPDPARNGGAGLILASALTWALASLVLRHRRPRGSLLAAAAYQMVFGGLGQTLLGLALGEAGEITAEQIRGHPGAVYAFFHLLVVGSLVGFVAYNWLLCHVSAALAGTYAYVNPVVAVVVGWLIGGEMITGWVVGGMAVILAGVALVRSGVRRPRAKDPSQPA